MSVVNDDNYAVGGIDLYFDPTIGHASLLATAGGSTGNGFRTAARNMGNVVTSEIAANVTYLEHFISVNGKRRKDKTVSSLEAISIPFTFDEISETNLQRALLASNLGGSKLAPMQNPVVRGSVSMLFTSDNGNNLVYSIPKAIIRPDGNLSIGNGEDWWSQSMMLDIEYCSTSDHWASKPYGVIEYI